MKQTLFATGDTIFAPATAPGKSALAIIRMSGPLVREALVRLCGFLPEPGKLTLARVRDHAGDPLDQAMAVYLPGPRTATGEDVGEFHLHGSPAIIAAVSDELRRGGLRLAQPGEFTRRAVLSGKMDLTQAEALADLVDAETDEQRKQAMFQLYGSVSGPVTQWRDRLADALALFEAALDFSDEGDVDESALCGLAAGHVVDVLDEMRRALTAASFGERVRDGFSVVIAGPVNAGKSTLLNRLAGREAALVTAVPGTTRDLVEVRLDICGYAVRLVDTAGLRETTDYVESLGIQRGAEEARHADCLVWLVPARTVSTESVADARRKNPNTIVVGSQLDLGGAPANMSTLLDVCISARTGTGLDELVEVIATRLALRRKPEGLILTRARHSQAIGEAVTALTPVADRVARGIDPVEIALCAEDVRLALHHLGEITGHVGAEQILDRIFGAFCIGK